VQLCCMLGLLGALCGNEHSVTVAWGTMLRRYERVERRLQHVMELEYGPRLIPGLFVFHIQLILSDWFEDHTRTGQRFTVPAPDFAKHIRTFERQNNLNWLPSVPALFALCLVPRTSTVTAPTRQQNNNREPAAPRAVPRV
jgi:hypothetical protein